MILLILVDFALDELWIWFGENRFWSLLGVKRVKQSPDTMVFSLCSLYVQHYSEYEKNSKKQHEFYIHCMFLHSIHSLQKGDVSRLLLLKDLLQFDSCKHLPPLRVHYSNSLHFMWSLMGRYSQDRSSVPSKILLMNLLFEK